MQNNNNNKAEIAHTKLVAILETAVDAIITIDGSGIIDTFNPAAERLFGYSAAEIIGQNIAVLMPEPYSSKHDSYIKNYQSSRVRKIIGIGREVVAKDRNGNFFAIQLSVGEAEIGGKPMYVGFIQDITERKDQENELKRHRDHLQTLVEEKTQDLVRANEQLQKLVNIDGLTNLANRRYFDEVLNKEMKRASRYKHPLSLILCDIDFFKLFNDLYGHIAGDACLKQFSECLGESFKRASDLTARYGGEEFTVILPHTDIDEATKLAENFLGNIRQMAIPHEASTVSDILTTSIGIASLQSDEAIDANILINAADQQLYSAKQAGRNRIEATLLQL